MPAESAMNIPLSQMVRRRQPRRKVLVVRPIQPTSVMAADLYRAAYQPIVSALEAAQSKILAEFEHARPPMVRDSVADMEDELESLGDELRRLILTLLPGLRVWALRTERWHRGKWRGAILTATGIDLDAMLGVADVSETVEAFIARNVALMRDISAQAQARLSDIVFRSFTEVRPIREVAKEMSAAVGMSRTRAMRVAQDQASKLSAALDQARQEQAGGKKFKWHHSRKKHPRKEHQARDGKEYLWTDPDIKDDKPGMAPYCGCRAGFVLELD